MYEREAREEGREEGRISKLTEQICNLEAKGMSAEEMADILVESPERIRELMKQLD